MPKASAFNSTRFSSRPSHAELIYRQMVADLGSGANYSDDFDSLAMARVYANAMAFGAAKYAVERAGRQFRPSRVLELLPTLEAEYGIVPEPDATIAERRSELAVAARIARGASQVNIDEVLTELLGDDFVSYTTISTGDAEVTSATPGDVGIYATPGTPRSVFRLTDSVLFVGTPVTVGYEAVIGENDELAAGDVIVIDAGDHGRTEIVTITSATASTLTATFTNPHTAGVLMATGRHPYLMSSKRHNVFTLSEDAMASARTQARANRAIRRLLRGVSTWSLTDSADAFTVGDGLIGVTLIGTEDLPNPLPITTNLFLHYDMLDADSYTVVAGSPDTVQSLTNKASGVAATEATNPPEFEEAAFGGYSGLPCMRGDGVARHITSTEAAVWGAVDGEDAAATFYLVWQPMGSLDTDSVLLGFANSGVNTRQFRIGQDTIGSGCISVTKIDDAVATVKASTTATVESGPHLLTVVVHGTTASIYINDGAADPAAAAFNGGTITLDRFALFRNPDATPDTYANARIAEVACFSGAHTDDQRAEMTEYFMTKWSL